METRILLKEWLRLKLGPERSAALGTRLRGWYPRIDQNIYSLEQWLRRKLGGQIENVFVFANVDPQSKNTHLATLALIGKVEKLTKNNNKVMLRQNFEGLLQTRHARSSELMFAIGSSFLRLRDPVAAIKAFARVVALEPNDGKFHCGRKLLDYVQDNPTPECIAIILAGFSDVSGEDVPDLALGLIGAIENLNEMNGTSIEVPEMLYTALRPITLNNMGDKLLGAGDADNAIKFYLRSIRKIPEDALLRLQVGVTYFIGGHYREAERHWNILATTREKARVKLGIGTTNVRLLGESFFIAIGHTAYIDTYIKATMLGWRKAKRIIAPINMGVDLPGRALLPYLAKYIEQVHHLPGHIDDVVRKVDIKRSNSEPDKNLVTDIRVAVMDDFWYGPSADGNVRWFAPHGADVERAWKERGNGPLFRLTEEEVALFRESAEQVFGLPRDSWFVGLHVRTPGFHQKWHEAHPGTRNAEIETYQEVVNWVLAKGGWVVRLGDGQMPPYAPHERVIDYATSEYRNPDFDILFCATCSYFIGTNSGFSVVPAMFGRPCALTNWSPIAIPNWYLDDVYVPKLVRNRTTGELLSFSEMFTSVAGWSQFTKDYTKANLEIVENSPDDLLDATIEVHEAVRGRLALSKGDEERINRFNEIALANNGFIGSRISARFLKRYESLLN